MSTATRIAAIKKQYPTVIAGESDGCLRLTGTLDGWRAVVACGKLARDPKGLVPVVNGITLKGYTAPEISHSGITDTELDGEEPDVMIIGGGLVGAAIARELAK
ncbi:MAG: FAD/NAD(P)-binding oxidoreductase, partial [Clostridiales bacterium]|nr:FAD/NAD(P)-binding oxidoreductase [Clostridiales bacterium]